MNIRKVYLVGGPADGKRIVPTKSVIRVKVPAPVGTNGPQWRRARYERIEHAGMDLLQGDVALFMGWDH